MYEGGWIARGVLSAPTPPLPRYMMRCQPVNLRIRKANAFFIVNQRFRRGRPSSRLDRWLPLVLGQEVFPRSLTRFWTRLLPLTLGGVPRG